MTNEPLSDKDIFSVARRLRSMQVVDEYLDQVCGGDRVRRERIRTLVETDLTESSSGQLAATRPELVISSDSLEEEGQSIGNFKLLQRIGEGGMGVVFMAEQTEPVVRRVALKIIKPGMDSKDVIARFEAERQAIAMMDHPNIAKALDAGATDRGQPYFAMELVKGVPITKYCDEKKLNLRDRLELFIPVCQAVQHAHQKGIIHRDLKPSNILVAHYDHHAVPKIIDFGVAKATGQRLTDKTMFTRFGQVLGTYAYMSPEQAMFNERDVDTRTDLYSLGVILYELLTGETPLEKRKLHSAAFEDMLRMIRQEEPPRPSKRMTFSKALPSIAADRDIEPRRLAGMLRGDLDWIAMKALEKERSRRYQTANGLAMDIQRYLDNEPVSARPPSVSYVFRKIVQRHKVLVASASAVLLSLLMGLCGTVWFALMANENARLAQETANKERTQRERAEDAESVAEREAARAKIESETSAGVIEFLNKDLLSQASPYVEPDRDVKLRIVLDRAAERIPGRFDELPEVEAAIRQILAETFDGLGEYEKAEEHARRAAELRGEALGATDLKTIESEMTVLNALYRQFRLNESENICRDLLERTSNILESDDSLTAALQYRLATILTRQRRPQDAIPHYEEALKVYEQTNQLNTLAAVQVIEAMGIAYIDMGEFAEGEKLQRQAIDIFTEEYGPRDFRVAQMMHYLAESLRDQSRHTEALELQKQAVEIFRETLGLSDSRTVTGCVELVRALQIYGRHQDARSLLQEIPDPNHLTSNLRLALAELFAKSGQWSCASRIASRLITPESIRERPFDASRRIWFATLNLTSDSAESVQEFSRVLYDEFRQRDPKSLLWLLTMQRDIAVDPDQLDSLANSIPDSNDDGFSKMLLATAHFRSGRMQKALDALQHCGRDRLDAQYWKSMTLHQLGQADAAEEAFQQAETQFHLIRVRRLSVPMMTGVFPDPWWIIASFEILRREAWNRLRDADPPDWRWSQAIADGFEYSQRAHDEFERLVRENPSFAARSYNQLAALHVGMGRTEQAEDAVRMADQQDAEDAETPAHHFIRSSVAHLRGDFGREAEYLHQAFKIHFSMRDAIFPYDAEYWGLMGNDAHFEKISRTQPDDSLMWLKRGEYLGHKKKWEQALVAFENCIASEEFNEWATEAQFVWGHYGAAALYLEQGDRSRYHDVCRQLLRRFSGSERVMVLQRIAMACFLDPEPTEIAYAAKEHSENASLAASGMYQQALAHLANALGSYRRDAFADAIEYADRSIAANFRYPYVKSLAWLTKSMAQFRLEHKVAAAESLETASSLVSQLAHDQVDQPWAIVHWYHRLHYRILRQQAERLLSSHRKPEQVRLEFEQARLERE